MMDENDVSAAIEKAVGQCSIEKIQAMPLMQQTFALANGMNALRAALTKEVVERVFMPLQGSRLGFRTDKDDKDGYPPSVVRDCVMEAMVRGFRPIGNEMNIIAGNAYFTKEGFERKVAEFPGLSAFESIPGVPHVKDGGALVPYHAKWVLNGVSGELICDLVKEGEQTFDRRIPVRVNSGMGLDAILGKAKRKFLARVYERLSGVKAPDGDAADAGAIDTTAEVTDERQARVRDKTEELVNKHRAKRQKPEQQETMREPGEEG